MKLQTLRQYWKEANKYLTKHAATGIQPKANQFANMVLELAVEVERLRQIADEEHAVMSEYSLMPFGKYARPPLGPRKLADVPKDYLKWWLANNPDRGVILLEIQHGEYAKRAMAVKALRMWDFLKNHLTTTSDGSNQMETDRQG